MQLLWVACVQNWLSTNRPSFTGASQVVTSKCVVSEHVASLLYTFSPLTLFVGQQVGHPWWGAGVVICLEQGADLHMAQLMPQPLTVSCFSKIQIGFTFLVLVYLGSPGN